MSANNPIERLIERIAAKAVRKHGPEFSGIHSVREMAGHIRETLYDEQTKGFRRQDGGEVYYNPRFKTIVILVPNNERDGGTCYRYRRGGTSFEKLVKSETVHHGIAPTVHEKAAFRSMHAQGAPLPRSFRKNSLHD